MPTTSGRLHFVTDAVLAVALETAAGEPSVDCDHLTIAERHQLAGLLRWDMTPAILAWCSTPGPNDKPDHVAGPDYEGAILRRQEADSSRWG